MKRYSRLLTWPTHTAPTPPTVRHRLHTFVYVGRSACMRAAAAGFSCIHNEQTDGLCYDVDRCLSVCLSVCVCVNSS